MVIICPYCDRRAELTANHALYPHRENVNHVNYWWCEPCGALARCKYGTFEPIGMLANEELRNLRQQVEILISRRSTQNHTSERILLRNVCKRLWPGEPIDKEIMRKDKCNLLIKELQKYSK